MPSVGFEPANPASERSQTHALDPGVGLPLPLQVPTFYMSLILSYGNIFIKVMKKELLIIQTGIVRVRTECQTYPGSDRKKIA